MIGTRWIKKIIYGINNMTNELMNAIVSAITGAVAGGMVNLLLDKRKENLEYIKEKKKIYEDRPELQIIEYKEYIKCSAYKFKKECDINLFMTKMGKVSVENDIVTAHYNNDYFNEEEWCCVIYEFKNAGKTDIRCVSPVCTYKKDTMLCDVSNAKMILEYGWLSYSTMFDRKIRVGESFTTKICYLKDCIVSGLMSSIMFMCLEDCNNRFWNQPLFAPNNKIYDSYEIPYKEYKDEYLPDSAIECFKKPWLW